RACIAAPAAETVPLFLAAIGKIDLPVNVLLDASRAPALDAAPAGSEGNFQIPAGQQAVDAGEAGDRSRQGEESEDVVDAARIGARRNEARREQRLDLGREQEHFALGDPLA